MAGGSGPLECWHRRNEVSAAPGSSRFGKGMPIGARMTLVALQAGNRRPAATELVRQKPDRVPQAHVDRILPLLEATPCRFRADFRIRVNLPRCCGEGDASVSTTAVSNVASEPGRPDAKQSGKRENVVLSSGQYQRAMRASPSGVLRP